MAGQLRFALLGPIEATRGAEALRLPGQRQRALLAILLLDANRVVSADRLIDEVWAERPPASGRHALQVLVADVRKILGPDVLRSDGGGYRLEVPSGALDVEQFESLLARGRDELADGLADQAAATIRDALALWRGPALADLAYEPFAQAPATRLEELRLAAREALIDAELARGRHGDVIGELDGLVRAHPLRERFRAQLMLALYRAGRQAEALDAYQEARRMLVEELGIDPGQELQQLERDILTHAPALAAPPPTACGTVARPAIPVVSRRSILVASDDERELEDLLAIATPLASSDQPHGLILLRLIDPAAAATLAAATQLLGNVRARLAERLIEARVAAFTSRAFDADTLRLIAEQQVDLLLTSLPAAAISGDGFPEALRTVLSDSLADVALLARRDRPTELAPGGRVVTPFVGADHDWASLELAAWIAGATGGTLSLVGGTGDEERGTRDASRLLAVASLAVQELAGVVAEPAIVEPTADGLLAAATGASLVVIPFPAGWEARGLGRSRLALCRAEAPVLLVRAGVRPGGLAPPDGLSRYTWSQPGRA